MRLKEMTGYLDSLVESGIPSVDCIIMKEHEMVYRHMNGTTDERKTRKLQGDELYLMFSMTKVQTMTAVMQLVEQGRLSLEDEVGDYLPAYKDLIVEKEGKREPAKTPMKLWHLVSMQSGLDYNLERPGILRVLKEKGSLAGTREIVDSFVESPLNFEPGEHFDYSLSHDVAAAIVEKVSGMRFKEYLKKNLWEPLHMTNTYFAKPVNYEEKLVKQYICDNDGEIGPMEQTCNYQFSENYESGGAGLISCTKDYAVLGDTLACGGVSKEGNRILKPETIEIIKKNLLSETGLREIISKMGRLGYGYGVGMQVLMQPELLHTSAPKGLFGWDGAAGSLVMMDTQSKTSLVYTMHVRNCGRAYGEIHPKLRDLLFA